MPAACRRTTRSVWRSRASSTSSTAAFSRARSPRRWRSQSSCSSKCATLSTGARLPRPLHDVLVYASFTLYTLVVCSHWRTCRDLRERVLNAQQTMYYCTLFAVQILEEDTSVHLCMYFIRVRTTKVR